MRDDPISRIERWGYPAPEPEHPVCPVCGEECERYYVRLNDILGCENCIDEWFAEDYG